MPKPLKRSSPLTVLQERIGYRFHDVALLQRALTHSSACESHMERLEFLGDAVLGLAISQALHGRFADAPEGDLSRMRAALVCKEGLLRVAGLWELECVVCVGDSQKGATGIKSKSITANAVEAIIGAIFEDGGWDAACRVVRTAWQEALDAVDVESSRDAKSRLQELTQGEGWGLPEYRVVDRGAGTQPRFEAICLVRDKQAGAGRGNRKKSAELAAAEAALIRLAE